MNIEPSSSQRLPCAPCNLLSEPKYTCAWHLPRPHYYLPISTAFAEDGLYLGCGVNTIRNKYVAIIVPALFFALQHSFIPTLFDVRYVVYRFISFLPLTIILCWKYYKSRNPLPIMIGHAIIDVATVMQILATSMVPGLYEMMCSRLIKFFYMPTPRVIHQYIDIVFLQ